MRDHLHSPPQTSPKRSASTVSGGAPAQCANRPAPVPQPAATDIAPAGIEALGSVYGYIVQSGLPRLLVNLIYLRVSQINGCAYCIDMHSRDLIKEGLAVEKLVLVQAWREAGSLFDTRERSSLSRA
jgi:AhpD family alkylhydroperoxidase